MNVPALNGAIDKEEDIDLLCAFHGIFKVVQISTSLFMLFLFHYIYCVYVAFKGAP